MMRGRALLRGDVEVKAVLLPLKSVVNAHEQLIQACKAASDQRIVDVVNGLGHVIDGKELVDVDLVNLLALDLVHDANKVFAIVLVR